MMRMRLLAGAMVVLATISLTPASPVAAAGIVIIQSPGATLSGDIRGTGKDDIIATATDYSTGNAEIVETRSTNAGDSFLGPFANVSNDATRHDYVPATFNAGPDHEVSYLSENTSLSSDRDVKRAYSSDEGMSYVPGRTNLSNDASPTEAPDQPTARAFGRLGLGDAGALGAIQALLKAPDAPEGAATALLIVKMLAIETGPSASSGPGTLSENREVYFRRSLDGGTRSSPSSTSLRPLATRGSRSSPPPAPTRTFSGSKATLRTKPSTSPARRMAAPAGAPE